MSDKYYNGWFKKARRNAIAVDVIVFAIGLCLVYVAYGGFSASGPSATKAVLPAIAAVLVLVLASLLLVRLIRSYRKGSSRRDE